MLHITVTLHNPTGQAGVQRSNCTLKVLIKAKGRIKTPRDRLYSAPLTLNSLSVNEKRAAAVETLDYRENWNSISLYAINVSTFSMEAHRHLALGIWFVSISTGTEKLWIPSKLINRYLWIGTKGASKPAWVLIADRHCKLLHIPFARDKAFIQLPEILLLSNLSSFLTICTSWTGNLIGTYGKKKTAKENKVMYSEGRYPLSMIKAENGKTCDSVWDGGLHNDLDTGRHNIQSTLHLDLNWEGYSSKKWIMLILAPEHYQKQIGLEPWLSG